MRYGKVGESRANTVGQDSPKSSATARVVSRQNELQLSNWPVSERNRQTVEELSRGQTKTEAK